MVLIPRDMEHYLEWSRRVMGIVREEVARVEVVGLDEAYLDLSDSDFPKSECRRVKHRIREDTGMVCSIGLAPNKLLAKIASDLDKPDGFCVLRREQMLEAVGEHPATLIPGVGPKTAERLEAAGIRTVGELATATDDVLGRALGPRAGRELRERANGIDEREIETERERKSESVETTFPHNVDDPLVLRETLERLVANLCERLDASGHRGRTITLKIRLQPFRTFTRSKTLETATRDPDVVRTVARELLGRVELDAPVRLLGIGLAALESKKTSSEGGELPAIVDLYDL